jgi:hypothetical protein
LFRFSAVLFKPNIGALYEPVLVPRLTTTPVFEQFRAALRHRILAFAAAASGVPA